MRKFLQPFIPAAFLLMAAFIMSSSPAAAKSLAVDVAPNLDTFDAMREAVEGAMSPTGPFYIEGQIFDKGTLNPDGSIPEGATAIGTFYCWGWTYDGVAGNAVVSQIFAIDGRGEVHVQGLETFDLNRAEGEAVRQIMVFVMRCAASTHELSGAASDGPIEIECL